MRRDPDCNRTDLDDEGEPEELDFESDVNTLQLDSVEEDEDE